VKPASSPLASRCERPVAHFEFDPHGEIVTIEVEANVDVLRVQIGGPDDEISEK
jgi:hypothetical protein